MAAEMPYPESASDHYAPMPTLGTMQICLFCHFVVQLHPVASGWHHWAASRDPLDGGWHCDGGQPGTTHNPALRTLHLPGVPDTAKPFAPRYDADGAPHYPQG